MKTKLMYYAVPRFNFKTFASGNGINYAFVIGNVN